MDHYINGFKIVESALISPVPKLFISVNFTACSAECKASMNAWLLERFGTYLPAYKVRDTIVMHPKHVAALKSMKL